VGSARPPLDTRSLGQAQERRAADHLIRAGLEILDSGVVAGGVEIDIIARTADLDDPVYVFVEVRSRESDEFGEPSETVGPRKQRRLLRGAAAWLSDHGLYDRVTVRFDVISIVGHDDTARLTWIVSAFDSSSS